MRYKLSCVDKNSRFEVHKELIAALIDSKTVNVAYHANDISPGLSGFRNPSLFKLFICDTGLFTTLVFKDKDFTDNIIYQKLLTDKLGANLGYLYENVVAQILVAKGDALFYHTFPSSTSNYNYEIDFVISRENKVCPIEVKSSSYKTHKSLDVFSSKYSAKIFRKYLVCNRDRTKDEDVFILPPYFVPYL